MNSLAALTVLYTQLTVCAAGILIYSFWGKFDASARYFLVAEVCVIVTATSLGLANYYPESNISLKLFSGNLFSLSTEISVLFGLISLTKKTKIKDYFLLVFLAAIWCAIAQQIRVNFGIPIAVILQCIPSIILTIITVKFCISKQNILFSNNQFFRWIKWFEFGILMVWIIRFLSGFITSPIEPRNPTIAAVIIFSAHIVFSVFRYFSYIGLRITLVDPVHPNANRLNKTLASTFLEKNELLRGLISSNRVIAISALASSLAHQLSQPLTSIAFQAASAKRRFETIADQSNLASSLNEISSESEKLANLVSNLRRLFSQQRHAAQSVDVVAITNQIIEFLEPALASKQIQLQLHFLANPTVIADEIQLQQVLINLFNNSIDAIEGANSERRLITLSIEQHGAIAALSIEDSGPGIPPKLQEQIFELYKTSKQTGLGVGLWLCKTIVENYHGSIKVANSSYGGAKFTIELPAITTLSSIT